MPRPPPRAVAGSEEARGATVSRAELEVLAKIGRREGTIDQAEWQVMTNIMNLEDVDVAQVMTPRTRMVAISAGATMKQAQHLMLETGRLRLPVYDGDLDHGIGILLARDLWKAQAAGVQTIAEVLREATFVPESKPVEELIRQMRQQRIKMAIVLDEYGGTTGLVTLEDLIEEIVGEIQDEHEEDPLPFEEALEGETRLGGSVSIDEVNERFGLALPQGDYETVGGFVFGTLGRVAEVGDEVVIPGGRLRVEAMDGRRIDRLAFLEASAPAAEKEPQSRTCRTLPRDLLGMQWLVRYPATGTAVGSRRVAPAGARLATTATRVCSMYDSSNRGAMMQADDLIQQVAQRAGISEAQARTAVETVIRQLEKRLPAPMAGELGRFMEGKGAGNGPELGDIAKGLGGMLGRK